LFAALNDFELVGETVTIKIIRRKERLVEPCKANEGDEEEDIIEVPSSEEIRQTKIDIIDDGSSDGNEISSAVSSNGKGNREEVAALASMLNLLGGRNNDRGPPSSPPRMPPPPPPSNPFEASPEAHSGSASAPWTPTIMQKEKFGFFATKRGSLFPSWKRRYFQCDSAKLITYWTSDESAKAGIRTTAGGFRGEIRVDTVVRILGEVSIRDQSGHAYRLQMESNEIAHQLELEYEALDYYHRKEQEMSVAEEAEAAGEVFRDSTGWFWGTHWGAPAGNGDSDARGSNNARKTFGTAGINDGEGFVLADELRITMGLLDAGSASDGEESEMLATLGSGNLGVAVVRPHGVESNEWLAMNTIDFCNEVTMLCSLVSDAWADLSHQPGEGFPNGVEYRWSGGVTTSTPIRCTPCEYVEYVLDWIEVQLEDPKLFPRDNAERASSTGDHGSNSPNGFNGSNDSTEPILEAKQATCRVGRAVSDGSCVERGYPSNFRSSIATILTQVFRVYAILYTSHLKTLEALNAVQHLNTCFKHFLFFCFEFSFIDEDEFSAVQGPVSQMKVSRALI
jgi:MOB kinase activator 1